MAYVEGIDQVNRNIMLALESIKGRTEEGMYQALKHLERQMDTVRPMVPWRTGALRNSWYIEKANNPASPQVFAGYSAYHAPIVHEMMGDIAWTRPGSGAKWLQIHFARERREMELIVAQYAKI